MVETAISKEINDNLILNGSVIEIKYNKVKIYVKSLSCRGEREFVIDSKFLSSIKEGDNIGFIIDSSKCENNKSHKIIEVFKR